MRASEKRLAEDVELLLAGETVAERRRRQAWFMLRLLLWIGIVRFRNNGTVRWPLHIQPLHMWRYLLRDKPWVNPPVGMFHNHPDVTKYEPGRLLPRRWGFYIVGLEIGDRG